jgi:hypothetical protein
MKKMWENMFLKYFIYIVWEGFKLTTVVVIDTDCI